MGGFLINSPGKIEQPDISPFGVDISDRAITSEVYDTWHPAIAPDLPVSQDIDGVVADLEAQYATDALAKTNRPDTDQIDAELAELISYDSSNSATEDMFSTQRAYFRSIGKIPVLEAEEEVELAKTIEAGVYAGGILRANFEIDPDERRDFTKLVIDGEEAMQKFITSNLRLVVSIARHYLQTNNLPRKLLMDLVSDGNLGLYPAVIRFDYTKGYKFSTYATWWINKSLKKEAGNKRVISLPQHINEAIVALRKLEDSLTETLNRAPTVDELAAEMELTPERITQLLLMRRVIISTDMPMFDEDESPKTYGDCIEDLDAEVPGQRAIFSAQIEQALRAMDTFSENDRLMLEMFFGLNGYEPMFMNEIAPIIGHNAGYVSTHIRKSLAKLRTLMDKDY